MKKNIIKTNIIKASSLILLALLCGLFASCMNGDWDEPDNTQAPFGNNSLTESNVITIADLIKKYPNVFASTDQNQEITEDIQIKGRVTGNDLGGNIYKQIILQDNTAAIIIAVNEGGLFGHLAEGQEILVNLKGLYIGGYRRRISGRSTIRSSGHPTPRSSRLSTSTRSRTTWTTTVASSSP